MERADGEETQGGEDHDEESSNGREKQGMNEFG
jgi:hypothetical protein